MEERRALFCANIPTDSDALPISSPPLMQPRIPDPLHWPAEEARVPDAGPPPAQNEAWSFGTAVSCSQGGPWGPANTGLHPSTASYSLGVSGM